MLFSNTLTIDFKIEIDHWFLIFNMSPDLRTGCTFASFRHFGNQPRDKYTFRISNESRNINGSEVSSTSAETPSIPAALLFFKLPTVFKT